GTDAPILELRARALDGSGRKSACGINPLPLERGRGCEVRSGGLVEQGARRGVPDHAPGGGGLGEGAPEVASPPRNATPRQEPDSATKAFLNEQTPTIDADVYAKVVRLPCGIVLETLLPW